MASRDCASTEAAQLQGFCSLQSSHQLQQRQPCTLITCPCTIFPSPAAVTAAEWPQGPGSQGRAVAREWAAALGPWMHTPLGTVEGAAPARGWRTPGCLPEAECWGACTAHLQPVATALGSGSVLLGCVSLSCSGSLLTCQQLSPSVLSESMPNFVC